MITEDYNIFFNLDEFATSAVYQPLTTNLTTTSGDALVTTEGSALVAVNGYTAIINGIFDANYLNEDNNNFIMVEATHSFLTNDENVLTETGEGILIVNGVTYDIVSVEKDYTGLTNLMLNRK